MTDQADILRSSWRAILEVGEPFLRIFYEVVFDIEPAARALFPVDMRAQRRKLGATLGAVVQTADNLDAAVPRLRQLGRDHVRYGASPSHYPVIGNALLFTGNALVPSWTPDDAEAWNTYYGLAAAVMVEAAASVPPPGYVEAPVVEHAAGDGLFEVWVRSHGGVPHPGEGVHVTRSDRVGEWLTGSVTQAKDDLICVQVVLPNTPAGWGLANLPADARLRLAPVFEETDHA